MGYATAENSVADAIESKTESLSNWVRQVRSKSLNAKRRRNRDLRVIAILSHSLSRAETELITKQRERARKWAQMQLDLGLRNAEEDASKQHKDTINGIWSSELSGLDSFFKDLDNFKCVET